MSCQVRFRENRSVFAHFSRQNTSKNIKSHNTGMVRNFERCEDVLCQRHAALCVYNLLLASWLPSLLTYLPKDSNTSIRARSLNVFFFGYLETYKPTTQNMFCFALWLLLVNVSLRQVCCDLQPNYLGGVFRNVCRSSCKVLLFLSLLNQNLDIWNWSNFMKIR